MTLIEQNEWAEVPGLWHGMWEGGALGAPVTIIFNSTVVAGFGPRLHRHPYPEIFIIRAGRALFTLGDTEVEAGEGQILVCATEVPHKFAVLGTAPFESIDIHCNGTSITRWLE
ncbi:cupin domain-containing protein [Pelagibacterium limicola]|uniref:cupin domain-containing protein n=1 Tax=Pelagibacterium limicola TaxID=2791022 RepID=UPI0018AF8D8C|nr:cupin domain-containing protein [Pelagibacterium limicola]